MRFIITYKTAGPGPGLAGRTHLFLFGCGAAVKRAAHPAPVSCATAKVSAQTTSAAAAALKGIQKILAVSW